jgi:pimeloyl-ACP methyl ester carboxylesterase
MKLNHFRTGTGPPLVLIHGIGSHWQVWEPVLGLLAGAREVIALDLPGFGDSPMPPPGNSLGGLVSLELATQGRVASATALSPGGFANPRETAFARGSLRLTVAIARLLEPWADRLSASPTMRKLTWSQVVARPERISAADAAASARALVSAPWFAQTLRAIPPMAFRGGDRIQVPVTVAWGEKDRLLLPRQARRAAAAIPTARMVVLSGCGHVPTYDDPEQVARVILEGSSK